MDQKSADMEQVLALAAALRGVLDLGDRCLKDAESRIEEFACRYADQQASRSRVTAITQRLAAIPAEVDDARQAAASAARNSEIAKSLRGSDVAPRTGDGGLAASDGIS